MARGISSSSGLVLPGAAEEATLLAEDFFFKRVGLVAPCCSREGDMTAVADRDLPCNFPCPLGAAPKPVRDGRLAPTGSPGAGGEGERCTLVGGGDFDGLLFCD